MFFIIKLKDGFTGENKFYVFVDKAGSEIPYEIASQEFVRLSNNINKLDLIKYRSETKGNN